MSLCLHRLVGKPSRSSPEIGEHHAGGVAGQAVAVDHIRPRPIRSDDSVHHMFFSSGPEDGRLFDDIAYVSPLLLVHRTISGSRTPVHSRGSLRCTPMVLAVRVISLRQLQGYQG